MITQAPLAGDKMTANRRILNMPKVKTNRSAAKRFKRTATGKYRFNKSHASHILTKKTRKRKRALRKAQILGKSDMKEVRRLLPHA